MKEMEKILEIAKKTNLNKAEDMAYSLGQIIALAEIELMKGNKNAVRH